MFLYIVLWKIVGLCDFVCKFLLVYMNKVFFFKVKGGGFDFFFNISIYVWFLLKYVEYLKRYFRYEFGMLVLIIYCLCNFYNIFIEWFIFFLENKDMGRFFYEMIKKVNVRKILCIVNLN